MESRLSFFKILSQSFLWTGTALSLTGCGEVRKTLGLDPPPPDEFTVVEHAPLVLPPDFNLRPPQPGAARPQEKTVIQEAQEVLQGSDGTDHKTSLVSFEESGVDHVDNRHTAIEEVQVAPSTGEKAFIQNIPRYEEEEPLNRQTFDQETSQTQKPKNFVQKLLFWQDKPGEETLDPQKEQDRLEFERHQAWREEMLRRRQEEEPTPVLSEASCPPENSFSGTRDKETPAEGTLSSPSSEPNLEAKPQESDSLTSFPSLLGSFFKKPPSEEVLPVKKAAPPANCGLLYGTGEVSFSVLERKQTPSPQNGRPAQPIGGKRYRPLTHTQAPDSYKVLVTQEEAVPKSLRKKKKLRSPKKKRVPRLSRKIEDSFSEDILKREEDGLSLPASESVSVTDTSPAPLLEEASQNLPGETLASSTEGDSSPQELGASTPPSALEVSGLEGKEAPLPEGSPSSEPLATPLAPLERESMEKQSAEGTPVAPSEGSNLVPLPEAPKGETPVTSSLPQGQ